MTDDDDLFAVRPKPARKRIDKPAARAAPVFKPNPGRCPDEARGKRVAVRLENGREPSLEPVAAVTPPGWSADGPNGCRWSKTGHPFDIREYRVL